DWAATRPAAGPVVSASASPIGVSRCLIISSVSSVLRSPRHDSPHGPCLMASPAVGQMAYSGQLPWRAPLVATFLKTTELSIDGAHTLPGEYYTSREIFGLEMDRIFLRRWLCIGREDVIPNPGDYVLQAVDKESVIVLRDKSGGVRAYHNVCRHRGTRLCEEHTGHF